MAYGDYYDRGAGAPSMRDIVDPAAAAPRFARRRDDPSAYPVGPQPGAPAPTETLDRWGRPPGHPQYGQPPVGVGENVGPWAGGWGAQPKGTTTVAPRTYQGGALAYYGTGNIDGVEHIFANRGTAGKINGFNEGDWGSGKRGTMSIKNVNGALFTRYAAKPSSIPLLMADPDFKSLFPNAKQVGFDKIDYGDGRPVDVLEAADPEKDTSNGWAWMPESDQVPEGAGTMAASDLAARGNRTQPVGGRTGISDEAYRNVTAGGYRGPSFREWVSKREGI